MQPERKPNNSFSRLLTDNLELAPLTDHCDEKPLQNGSLEKEDDEEEAKEEDCKKQHVTIEEQHKLEEEKQRQKKKYTRLSRLRRRRCAHKDTRGEDESDLSEGFESEEEEDEDEERRAGADPAGGAAERTPENPAPIRKEQKRDHLGEEGSWGSGSDEEEEEEEEGGTAFDVETDSDMNSQESRSDLEDMEDGESSLEGQGREQHDEGDEQEGRPKGERAEGDRDTPPTANGPLLPADSSISSNLQAMSSQLFQAKRCFRLAPTFSNMLLRPQASLSSAPLNTAPTDTSTPPSQETPPPIGESLSDVNPATANGTTENGMVLHLSV